MNEKKKRSGNITNEQRTLLTEFMLKNSLLRSGKFSTNFTFKDATALWQSITNILNASNGACKDWKSWRKTWQDLRSRSKAKHNKIKTDRNKTGGGQHCAEGLTATEGTVLAMIGSTSIDGNEEIEESPVEIFDFDEEMDGANEGEIEFLMEDLNEIQEMVKHNTAASKDSVNIEDFTIENVDPTKIITVDNVPNKSSRESKRNILETKSNAEMNVKVSSSKEVKHKNVTKMKASDSGKRLVKPTECAQNLTYVAEKTYELKKQFAEERLRLLERDVIAKEKIAAAIELYCKTKYEAE